MKTRTQENTQQNQNQQEKIQKKAYELAQRRGFAPGHELDDWLEAERIVVVNATIEVPQDSGSGSGRLRENRQEQSSGRSRF